MFWMERLLESPGKKRLNVCTNPDNCAGNKQFLAQNPDGYSESYSISCLPCQVTSDLSRTISSGSSVQLTFSRISAQICPKHSTLSSRLTRVSDLEQLHKNVEKDVRLCCVVMSAADQTMDHVENWMRSPGRSQRSRVHTAGRLHHASMSSYHDTCPLSSCARAHSRHQNLVSTNLPRLSPFHAKYSS